MTTREVDLLVNKIIEDMQYAEELIDNLHSLGYQYNFDLAGNKLVCVQTQMYFFTREFQVDKVYRFDQEPIGIDDYYLYALRDPTGQPVGVFTAYSVSDATWNRRTGS